MADNHQFDWSELVFAAKSTVNDLNAVFIAAPREISLKRFNQLVKAYVPYSNLIIGIAKEKYIDGFDNQPQFKTLQLDSIEASINKVNQSNFKHKIYILNYFQRDLKYILEKLKFKEVIFINGSWKYVFHVSPSYYVLTSKRIEYRLVSPFASENEAKTYEGLVMPEEVIPSGEFSESEMLSIADTIAKRSYDYLFQTGVSLGTKKGSKYHFIAQSYNKVEPYQTYAMHHGSVREINFAPINDLNFYDTCHAEVRLIVQAQKRKLDINNTCLFTNLLPCPNCARMLCETGISEIVYKDDHSDGYAAKLLMDAGINVRRVVQ